MFNSRAAGQSSEGKVEELLGDRNTGDLSALAGHEWDVCIDNPTTLPFWVRDAGKALAGKIGQYVFISTISVYAKNDKPADESDALAAPYTGKDPMAETCSLPRRRCRRPLRRAGGGHAVRRRGDSSA